MNTGSPSNRRLLFGSLFFRVLLALALILTFYIGTAAIIAGLFCWPLWHWKSADEPNFFLFLFAWLSAFFIVQGLWRSREVFEAPGPELREDEHPALHAFVKELALASNTHQPSHIYLTVDMNAFVGEVGGMFGIGQRRVMVLGMALLSYLNVEQLRGVLAHEFGHFHKAHLWLGAQIYGVRALLGRVLQKGEGSPTTLIFRLYAEVFMRATQAISREQEREADRHAIRLVGGTSYGETLMRMSKASAMFQWYFEKDVQPLFEAGYYPNNIFSGFHQAFQQAEKDGVLEKIEPELLAQKATLYDSHPSLTDRLHLVEEMQKLGEAGAQPSLSKQQGSARELLNDPDRLEEGLSAMWAEGLSLDLAPLTWSEVVETIVHPAIQERLRIDHDRLCRLTQMSADVRPAELLWAVFSLLEQRGLQEIIDEMYPPHADILESERRALAQEDLIQTLGLLLGAVYVESGGCWSGRVGRPFLIEWENTEFDPVTTMENAFNRNQDTSWHDYFRWNTQEEPPAFEHGT